MAAARKNKWLASLTETERFEMMNPNLLRLDESEHKDVLEWAESKNFIKFYECQGKKYYTSHNVEAAMMWKSKIEE